VGLEPRQQVDPGPAVGSVLLGLASPVHLLDEPYRPAVVDTAVGDFDIAERFGWIAVGLGRHRSGSGPVVASGTVGQDVPNASRQSRFVQGQHCSAWWRSSTIRVTAASSS
jgi:hypothetical protein